MQWQLEVGGYTALSLSLKWLINNGIEEVFLFYSKLKTQLEEYIANLNNAFSDLKIHLHYMKPLNSVGDVLREVHFRNIIAEDFLLAHGDCITNIDVAWLAEQHFNKKKELKDMVLTTAMQTGLSQNIYVLNESTKEILQIETECSDKFSLNTEKINLKKVGVELRRDLVETEVYICTIEVIKSFKETHECQSIIEFIIGMTTSDVYIEKIQACIVPNEKVSYRLGHAHSYFLCCMAFINNYFNIPISKETIVCKFNKFFHNTFVKKESVTISHNVYIGSRTVIQEDTNIYKSIIGNNCNIGKNVKLSNCIVTDNCLLKDHSEYNYSLIENVGGTVQFHCFKDKLTEYYPLLKEKELFRSTPPTKELTLSEEIALLVQEGVENVGELRKIKNSYNGSCKETTIEVFKAVQPKGIKGIESFVNEYGRILLELHEGEHEMLESMYGCCVEIVQYEKAFHILLQFLHHEKIIQSENLLKWLNSKNLADTPTLRLVHSTLYSVRNSKQSWKKDLQKKRVIENYHQLLYENITENMLAELKKKRLAMTQEFESNRASSKERRKQIEAEFYEFKNHSPAKSIKKREHSLLEMHEDNSIISAKKYNEEKSMNLSNFLLDNNSNSKDNEIQKKELNKEDEIKEKEFNLNEKEEKVEINNDKIESEEIKAPISDNPSISVGNSSDAIFFTSRFQELLNKETEHPTQNIVEDEPITMPQTLERIENNASRASLGLSESSLKYSFNESINDKRMEFNEMKLNFNEFEKEEKEVKETNKFEIIINKMRIRSLVEEFNEGAKLFTLQIKLIELKKKEFFTCIIVEKEANVVKRQKKIRICAFKQNNLMTQTKKTFTIWKDYLKSNKESLTEFILFRHKKIESIAFKTLKMYLYDKKIERQIDSYCLSKIFNKFKESCIKSSKDNKMKADIFYLEHLKRRSFDLFFIGHMEIRRQKEINLAAIDYYEGREKKRIFDEWKSLLIAEAKYIRLELTMRDYYKESKDHQLMHTKTVNFFTKPEVNKH